LAEAKKSTDEKAAEEVSKQIKTLPKSPSKADETKASMSE
jgi:hypothetical protein